MRRVVLLGAFVALASSAASSVDAQSLRGSRTSVDRMHRHAKADGLYFYQTAAGVRRAGLRGVLVRLKPNANFALHKVAFPYVRAATRTFVQRLAAQYRRACGERLVVTSAARPAKSQPWNASKRSVHPTGAAIDLRKPEGKCLTWLRGTLLALEKARVLEATEEYGPPHFHVAVYQGSYRQYVARLTAASVASRGDATSRASESEGDTP
jgi:hypothetical protein